MRGGLNPSIFENVFFFVKEKKMCLLRDSPHWAVNS